MLVGQITQPALEYLAGLRNGFVGATLVVARQAGRHKTGPYDGREISTPGGSPGSKNVQIDSTILSALRRMRRRQTLTRPETQ